jgi:hypothetical protein
VDRGVVALRSATGEEHFAGKPGAHQSSGLFTLKTAMSLNRRAPRTPKEPLLTQSRFTCGMSPSEAPFSMKMPYSVSFVPFCSIFHFPV